MSGREFKGPHLPFAVTVALSFAWLVLAAAFLAWLGLLAAAAS